VSLSCVLRPFDAADKGSCVDEAFLALPQFRTGRRCYPRKEQLDDDFSLRAPWPSVLQLFRNNDAIVWRVQRARTERNSILE